MKKQLNARKLISKNKKISDTFHKKKITSLSLKEKIKKIKENKEQEKYSMQRLLNDKTLVLIWATFSSKYVSKTQHEQYE